jgi:hypothetical protein
MLRASLLAMSVLLAGGFTAVSSASAGPFQHPHHRAAVRASFGAPVGVSAPTRRVAVQAPGRFRPIFAGRPQAYPPFAYLPSGYLPSSAAGRTIVASNGAHPALEANVTVTINPVPVVMGIRRAPDAAPVIYRISDGLQRGQTCRMAREQGRRRRMALAGVHHVQPDTTTPRIIIVRGSQRN